MSLYFPPAAFSRFFHYRMDLSTSFYNTKDLFPVPILFFGDIIDIMSSTAFFLSVRAEAYARSLFQRYKSEWYRYCCDLTNRPNGRYPFPRCKTSWQTNAADCEETPCFWKPLPVHTRLSYHARCSADLTVFRSLSQRLLRL